MISVETTLSELNDIVLQQNDKFGSQVGRIENQLRSIENHTSKLDERIVEIVENLRSRESHGRDIEELRELTTELQKNDASIVHDMKILRDRMETELVAKLALTLRNRDDLLRRLETIEGDMEQLRIDTSERVSKAEEKLGAGGETQG